jgi:hypothetical protein
MQEARGDEKATLDLQQLALKIMANATSYGIFVEIIVDEQSEKQGVRCYGDGETPFTVLTSKQERPGSYFHPLLATLITGAARLKLAIIESLARDAGLDWAICDTDSMALAKPEGMSSPDFYERAQTVCGWFDPLNPYSAKGPLLKVEEVNHCLAMRHPQKELQPLFCFAISAKRYALFNIDGEGRAIIRKASAHGLGHLREPYGEAEAPPDIPLPSQPLSAIGVSRWQYDLWHQIIRAALDGHPQAPDLNFHRGLGQPATGRYNATTPELLRWFKAFNEGRLYADQVRPFGFLTALHAVGHFAPEPAANNQSPFPRRRRRAAKPIAPFHKDPAQAAEQAFDRETGDPVPGNTLKSFRSALARYHLHPEAKFLNADYLDSGHCRRRHIVAIQINYIGKEADRLEEQFYLGAAEDAVVDYGVSPKEISTVRQRVQTLIQRLGQRAVSRVCGVSLRDVNKAARNPSIISQKLLLKIDRHLVSPMTASEIIGPCPPTFPGLKMKSAVTGRLRSRKRELSG